jgi:hypothetical protein
MVVDLQLPMQSVPTTTDVLIRISIRAGCTTLCDKEKFVSDLWQVGGFLFGLTRPGFEPTIYHTRGEHANHYTTDAVTMAKKEKEQTQYKTKDRATRTPLNTGVNLGAPEG